MERVNLLRMTDVNVTVTDVNVSLLADFYEGREVPAYIKGYITAQALPGAPQGGIVDAIIKQEVEKAMRNVDNFAASMGVIPDIHKPGALDALQRELDTRMLERILNDVVGACCERDYDGDGNCDRHPALRLDEKDNIPCDELPSRSGGVFVDFGDPADPDFFQDFHGV